MNKSIFCATTSITLLAGAMIAGAAAQTQNPIDYCRETSDGKKERIACLEAAITTLMNTQTAAAGAPSGAAAETAPLVATAETDEAAAPPDEPTGLGAEQVIRRQEKAGKRVADNDEDKDKKKETVDARVDEFAYNPYKKLIVFLDNGQVWRQTSSDSVKIRLSKSRTHDVTISKGAMGAYRMTIHSMGRAIRVERIR